MWQQFSETKLYPNSKSRLPSHRGTKHCLKDVPRHEDRRNNRKSPRIQSRCTYQHTAAISCLRASDETEKQRERNEVQRILLTFPCLLCPEVWKADQPIATFSEVIYTRLLSNNFLTGHWFMNRCKVAAWYTPTCKRYRSNKIPLHTSLIHTQMCWKFYLLGCTGK